MLYAAVLRQQADGLVVKTCDSALEEHEDFASAARLFQRAAGIYAYVDTQLLPPQETPSGSK